MKAKRSFSLDRALTITATLLVVAIAGVVVTKVSQPSVTTVGAHLAGSPTPLPTVAPRATGLSDAAAHDANFNADESAKARIQQFYDAYVQGRGDQIRASYLTAELNQQVMASANPRRVVLCSDSLPQSFTLSLPAEAKDSISYNVHIMKDGAIQYSMYVDVNRSDFRINAISCQ